MNPSTKPDEFFVTHNEAEQQFETQLRSERAVCEYRLDGDRMVFIHTYVPAALRGQGIAEKLVRAGLEYARARRLPVVPSCSYVATFIQRHPEFQRLVV